MNGRNKTCKNKASHRVSEVNYIGIITWIWPCESQGWIWWPEGSFQACFPWKQYLKPCVPSLMPQSLVLMSQYWVLWWAINWNLLVRRCHTQSCSTETYRSAMGSLSKPGLFIVGLTCASSAAYVLTAYHIVDSFLPLMFLGEWSGKFVFT